MARVRYRQARYHYDRALELLTETDYDILAEPRVDVTVEVESGALPQDLAALPGVDAAAIGTLATAGIDTRADLHEVDAEMLTDLRDRDGIDEDLAATLRALSWWHTDEIVFTERDDIVTRREHASEGFQACL